MKSLQPSSGDKCLICESSEVELFCTAFDRVRRRREKRWDILRCRRCGFGWTSPPLSTEEIGSHYPETYLGDTVKGMEEFLAGRLQKSRSWRKETEKVKLVERFAAGGKILDVGCGDGRFLWAHSPERWERHGVEFSSKTVELVQARMPEAGLIPGDIYSTALQVGVFDVITLWHVLEHLPEPRRVLRRLNALLRPGGWLFLSVPNFASIQACLFRQYWYAFDDVPRHLYHFSPASLIKLVSESKLESHRRLFFSRLINFHCLKYSLINTSEEHFGSRLPYYLLKPLLFGFTWIESISSRYGIMTLVVRKPLCGASCEGP